MPLDWQVVQNGLDFMENAVADMAAGDEARAKYVALHLFASIEVLIKARLAREHWSLTVANIGKATRAGYEKRAMCAAWGRAKG
jgi:hypothetical protein